MDATQWPPDWQRGLLELCVLRLLADGPTYGYEIATRLSDAGLGDVKGGTLYPLLKRLEKADEVSIEWRPGDGGPGRKFYQLNTAGRARLERLTDSWHTFSTTISAIVQPAHKER